MITDFALARTILLYPLFRQGFPSLLPDLLWALLLHKIVVGFDFIFLKLLDDVVDQGHKGDCHAKAIGGQLGEGEHREKQTVTLHDAVQDIALQVSCD